jgi:osomolarity two-component system, phosphorelay intermediate protein YPD1
MSYDNEKLIDESAINQLLEMDEDDNHDFSREILQEFFQQFNEKITEFDHSLENKDYDSIGKLGHFLKGSSAGVGAARIRDICDDIQHWQMHTTDPESYFEEKIVMLKEVIPETKKLLYQKVGWA